MASPLKPTPRSLAPATLPPTVSITPTAIEAASGVLAVGTSATAGGHLPPSVFGAWRQLGHALGTHLPNGINRSRAAGAQMRRIAR